LYKEKKIQKLMNLHLLALMQVPIHLDSPLEENFSKPVGFKK
jgi:hypothetical protein